MSKLTRCQEEVRKLIEKYNTLPSRPALDGVRSVMVYGAGNRGREVARVLQQRGVDVLGFLDRAAQEGDGVLPCFRPGDQSAQRLYTEREATVVVAVFNCAADPLEIQQQLTECGYSRCNSFYDFYRSHGEVLGESYWLQSEIASSGTEALLNDEENVVQAASVWSDDESRDIFLEILKFRLSSDLTSLRKPTLEEQYFPRDVPQWPLPPNVTRWSFVDGGAYIGDTLQDILNQGIAFEGVAAFEPEYKNFAMLKTFAQQNLQTCKTTRLFNAGLWSSSGTLHFVSNAGPGSRVDETGDVSVDVVALDDVLRDSALSVFHPTVIKLDVESAEIEALRGAEKTIAAARPALAVCLYHRAEHLWQIPLLIAKWQLGYKLYLRYHGYNGLETVLYAVHPESAHF